MKRQAAIFMWEQLFHFYLFISDIIKEGSWDQWTSTDLHKGPLYNNIKKIHRKQNLG